MNFARLASAALSMVLATAAAVRAPAWGPRPRITEAAIAALPPDSPIIGVLGRELDGLSAWCWMPDWRRSAIIRNDGTFLADDFLLFPGLPSHISHVAPHVEAAWAPAFRRALQALRMENPWNAARWVGALIHFVEDTGAPPHAWPRGPHGIMENWVPADRISIEGYRSTLLGDTDAAALDGFLSRMRRYQADAADRGRAMEPLAIASNRPAIETIALVSANESAKVAADVLHTLGCLAVNFPAAGGDLKGVIRWPASWPSNAPLPHVAVRGQPWSTVCSRDGAWRLRGVPPGSWEIWAAVPGGPPLRERVIVTAGTVVRIDLPLPPVSGYLMNPDFSIRWADPAAPDYWFRQKDAWESSPIPVQPRDRVRLAAVWADDADGRLIVRWRDIPSATGGRTQSEPPLRPGDPAREMIAPDWARWARRDLVMRNTDPTTVCRAIEWTPP